MPQRREPSSPPASGRRVAAWLAACAICGALGWSAGRAHGTDGERGAPRVDPGVIPCEATRMAAPPPLPASAPPSAATALATAGVADGRPPDEDVQAMLEWKLRQLAVPRPPPVASPEVRAAAELGELLDRQHGALVGECWNAQAPEDREVAARLKVVASAGDDGRLAGWRVFEIPETRRPELLECVGRVLSRAALFVSRPGAPLTVAGFVDL